MRLKTIIYSDYFLSLHFKFKNSGGGVEVLSFWGTVK